MAEKWIQQVMNPSGGGGYSNVMQARMGRGLGTFGNMGGYGGSDGMPFNLGAAYGGMGGFNPTMFMGLGGMGGFNPMMGGYGGMGGFNPMMGGYGGMGGFNPMMGGYGDMGGFNPMMFMGLGGFGGYGGFNPMLRYGNQFGGFNPMTGYGNQFGGFNPMMGYGNQFGGFDPMMGYGEQFGYQRPQPMTLGGASGPQEATRFNPSDPYHVQARANAQQQQLQSEQMSDYQRLIARKNAASFAPPTGELGGLQPINTAPSDLQIAQSLGFKDSQGMFRTTDVDPERDARLAKESEQRAKDYLSSIGYGQAGFDSSKYEVGKQPSAPVNLGSLLSPASSNPFIG